MAGTFEVPAGDGDDDMAAFEAQFDAPSADELAEPDVIENWYVQRFMRLRTTAFRDPAAYFHRYASLSPEAAVARALEIWRTINLRNLEENILPTRQRASLILRKGSNHRVESVALRKL